MKLKYQSSVLYALNHLIFKETYELYVMIDAFGDEWRSHITGTLNTEMGALSIWYWYERASC